jgi:PAS domain S-box-containing protein
VNLRVLFVEDSTDDVELMLRRLHEAGIEPEWQRVQTALALREALAGGPWELALVDYNLPGFGGLEALALLADVAPDLPAITVSGAISEEAAVATLTAGAVDYVLKVNLTRLAPAVLRALEGAELRREQRRAAEQARQTMYAIEHSSQAIAYVSRDGTILYSNAAAHAMGEVSAGAAIGQKMWAWSPMVDERRWAELWQAASERPVVDFEATMRLPGGEEHLLSTTLDYQERGEDSFIIVYVRDVTEHRAAEKRAAESEERFRLLSSSTPDSTSVQDTDLRYEWVVNPALGMNPEDFIGKTDADLVDAEQFEMVRALKQQVMDSGEALRVEVPLTDARGNVRHYAGTYVPRQDADGNVTGILSYFKDVTERKQAETVLAERERILATLLGNLPGMAYRCANDPQWTMQFVSAGCESLTGHSPEVLLGSTGVSYGDLVRPEDDAWLQVQATVARDEPWTLTYRILTADGEMKWVWERGVAVRDQQGNVEALEGFIQDITLQKAAEERLEMAVAEWRQTFDAMRDSVALLDGEGMVLRANAATKVFTGRGNDAVVAHHCYEVFHGSAEFHPDCPHQRALRSHEVETSLLEQDGHWLRVTFAPILAADGQPNGGVHVVSDVSDLELARRQLIESVAQKEATTEGVIAAIAATTEVRDPYTAGHQRRVSELAAAIARDLGFDEDRIEGVRVAGMVHDVGKITVPAEVLSKPGRLSAIEFELIKEHAQAGHDILMPIAFSWPVASVAIQHHERLDGSGYPGGLTGDAVLLEARIVAVADVVEAMSSHRPYRAAMGVESALAEISAGAGVTYDADAVAACLRVFEEQGFRFTA